MNLILKLLLEQPLQARGFVLCFCFIFRSMLSSDSDFISSDDDDDLEEMLCQIQKRLKQEDYFEYVVPLYSESVFVENFRVRRQMAENIAEKFENSSYYHYQAGGNGKLNPLPQILIFLWFAGHQNTGFRDVARRFSVSISSVCSVIRRVTRFISSLAVDVIKWPSADEKAEIETHFRGNGLPGVVGAIDGTHIKIDKPSIDPRSYLNRKRYFSIKLQVVCDHNRRIMDVFVGYPGSVHDSSVFRASTLFETLEEKCGELYILGDSAYPCLRHLLTPYRNTEHLSVCQNNFNEVLSRNMSVVGHCFELLKRRFRKLYHVKLRDINDIVHFIRACCVLHNLALQDTIVFEESEGEHEESPAEEAALGIDNRDDVTGVEKRNMIATQLQM